MKTAMYCPVCEKDPKFYKTNGFFTWEHSCEKDKEKTTGNLCSTKEAAVEDWNNYVLNIISAFKYYYEEQCSMNLVNGILNRTNGVTDPYPDFKHDKDSIWVLNFQEECE